MDSNASKTGENSEPADFNRVILRTIHRYEELLMLIRTIRRGLKNSVLRKAMVAWRHRGLQPCDCFLASYPKSGNTWVKFVLATICAKRSVEAWSARNQFVPAVGHQKEGKPVLPGAGRLIKTHESYRPAYKKAIFLVRDPRDVCVSYYHHEMRELGSKHSFSQFLARFVQGQVDGYRSWEIHTRSWVDAATKASSSIHPVRYEDLLVNPVSEFQKICLFLGLQISNEELIAAIEDNRPDRMREKEKQLHGKNLHQEKNSSFVRSAKANDWQISFSPEDLSFLQSHFLWSSQFYRSSEAGFDVATAIANAKKTNSY